MALVHSEVGVDHPGVVPQAGKRSLGDDLAEVHHDHLMAGSLDEREVVLDHDDGAALARELLDRLADPRAEHWVDASHRLVQDDQPSLGGGDAGELEQPFLAAAEPVRELVPELPELESLQDGPDGRPVGLLLAADPAGSGQAAPERFIGELAPGQQDVVHDGQVAPLARRLERPDQPEPGDDVGTLADDRLTGEPDAARVWLPEPGHEIHHRALARAVRPDQPQNLTFGNREGAVPHRVDPAERLGQALDLEQHGTHEEPPSSAACPSGTPGTPGTPGPPVAAGASAPTASDGSGRAGSRSLSTPGRSRKTPSGR